MKVVVVLSASLVLGLTACATKPEAPIKPALYPDAGTGNVPREEPRVVGFLVIDTPKIRVDQEGKPYELPNGNYAPGSSYLVPTGYSIHDREGRYKVMVPNHSALVVADEDPMEVVLPAGRYLVRLERPEGTVQTFWVTIVAGQFTQVDPARLGPAKPFVEPDTPTP